MNHDYTPGSDRPLDVHDVSPWRSLDIVLHAKHRVTMETLWLEANDKRVVSITSGVGDMAPLLGYGVDTFGVERALVKSLATYIKPKTDPYIDAYEHIETTTDNITHDLIGESRFDTIVAMGTISLSWNGHLEAAEANSYPDAKHILTGRYRGYGDTGRAALLNLIDNHPFADRRVRLLPRTLLEDM